MVHTRTERSAVSVSDLLDRPIYYLPDVDRVLRLTPGTAKRWIDGYVRSGRRYPPVIRLEPTGVDSVTWGEFVEARLLANFRRDVPMLRLRPAIERLRDQFGTRYPLAHAAPLLDVQGRELLLRIQDEVHLAPALHLVVARNDQLVLAEPAREFSRSAEYDGGVVVRLRPRPSISGVVVDPERLSGEPSVRGVPTSVLAELFHAGDGIDQLADWYELGRGQIEEALRFEQRVAPVA
jgi:uncharacterized protein (DUF433 family)